MTHAIGNPLSPMLAAALTAILLTSGSPLVAAQEAPRNFIVHPTARDIPDLSFVDGSGRSLTLKDFRGRMLLLNIWATWCGPCRREMPTLDRLQVRLGGERFQVVALSIDRAGASVVQKFYAETGVRHLPLFVDAGGRAGNALGLVGLPGTLLIDADGREVGRLIGPAEWDSPEMIGRAHV